MGKSLSWDKTKEMINIYEFRCINFKHIVTLAGKSALMRCAGCQRRRWGDGQEDPQACL